MDDKNLIKKIQSDLSKSNPKVINNTDNTSVIQKNFSSKYTEDISDSDEEDLTSYKNRNNKIINNLPNKNIKQKKTVKSSKQNKSEKSTTDIQYESEEIIEDKDKDNDNKEKNSENELSDSEHEYEYTDEFKKKVKDYVKNDDRIRDLQNELKILNTAKKTAEMEILKHLERLGESNINITGGKLRINQYESKEGLKEDLIKEALSEKIKDPKIIEFIFEKINEKRIANGKVQKSLKRTFERGDKKEKK
jgi:hypothetical protein